MIEIKPTEFKVNSNGNVQMDFEIPENCEFDVKADTEFEVFLKAGQTTPSTILQKVSMEIPTINTVAEMTEKTQGKPKIRIEF